jgi:hypothetical protein
MVNDHRRSERCGLLSTEYDMEMDLFRDGFSAPAWTAALRYSTDVLPLWGKRRGQTE